VFTLCPGQYAEIDTAGHAGRRGVNNPVACQRSSLPGEVVGVKEFVE